MTKTRTWTCVSLVAAVAVLLAGSESGAGQGQTGRRRHPPPPPPIDYHLTWLPTTLGILTPRAMNVDGDIVGYSYFEGQPLTETSRAFVYRQWRTT